MKRISLIISLCMLIIIISMQMSCKKQEVVEKFSIRPPFTGIDVPFSNFELDAQKGDSILLGSGTRIVIPGGILVDSTGAAVNGTVQIKFREFKSVAEIFISGIPLNWKTDSSSYQLESAGMYEIKAFQGNHALNIKQGSGIDIRLASFDASDGFSGWKLDGETGAWTALAPSTAEINIEKQTLLDKILKKRAAIEFTPGKNYFAFNYGDLLDMFFDNNYTKIYENGENKAIEAKIAKYGVKWSKMRDRTMIEYKNNQYYACELLWLMEDGKTMPDKVPDALEEWNTDFTKLLKYGELKRIKGNEYALNIKYGNTKFSCKMSIVFPLKYLFRYSAEKWQINFQKIDSIIEIENQRAKLMADAYRTMQASSFGVYNYDKLYHNPDFFNLAADFTSDANLPTESGAISQVYYFPEGQNVYISYPKYDWTKFYLPDSVSKGRIVAVLPNMQAAWYNVSELNYEQIQEIKTMPVPKYSFKLKATTDKITSAEQIIQLLNPGPAF